MLFEGKGIAKKRILSMILAAALALLPFFQVGDAKAADGLELSTSYPGLMVKAGDKVSFSIEISNKTGSPQSVALSASSLPDGWESYFDYSGKVLSRAYVKADASAYVNFNVQIPEDAAENTYEIILNADAGNGLTDTLTLELKVSSIEFVQGKFSSQYPALQGPSSATFEYSVNLTNNSGEDQSYSLSANAPSGWTVTFSPGYETKQIASLSVKAGESQTIKVSVKPAQSVTAGDYTVTCAAVSATETLSTELKVRITGTYTMSLSTPSGLLSLDAYTGRETPVTLSIKNTGTADLKDISLSSSAPPNWTVRFDNSSIDSLAAGSSIEVTAYVQPASNAIAGDYAISMTASTLETRSTADFRVAVKTPTVWGIVGVLIIIALAVGLYFMFKKFGRR